MFIAIHFARFGPYHLARLRSACEVLMPLGWRVLAFEIAGADATYEWERSATGVDGCERVTVFPDGVFERIPIGEMRRGIERELDRFKPDAVAIAGWGTVDARACLDWCKKHQAKSIVMSETRAADGKRVWWKEWVKSRIVRRFDGALCGGRSHKRYLVKLGIPEDRIAYGYNVVDNCFFRETGNAKSRMRNGSEFSVSSFQNFPNDRQCLVPYFLASNRFVGRKNLKILIRAYAKYVKSFQQSAHEVWPLVLLGDGELRGELESLCRDLGIEVFNQQDGENYEVNSYKLKTSSSGGFLVFTGFRQIEELPAFYAGAGAFVHPALEEPWGLVINEAMAAGVPVLSSRNVGAAEELVVHGETGFLFDPRDEAALAELLRQVADLPEEVRLGMGRAARDMVDRKAPLSAFGEGLAKLVL